MTKTGNSESGKEPLERGSSGTAALFRAFVAGFKASGEGWNGEYPFADHNLSVECDEDVCRVFDRWAKKSAHDTIILTLTRDDAQGLYDHTGTMPYAPGSWSNNVRTVLSEALALSRRTHDDRGAVVSAVAQPESSSES